MKKNVVLSTLLISAILLAGTAIADEFPVTATPGNSDPKVYLVHKQFDWGLDDNLLGGSTPDGFDAQIDGSVTPQSYLRKNEYAFTGEQVSEIIVARDLNGEADLSYATVTINEETETLCRELPVVRCDKGQMTCDTKYYVMKQNARGRRNRVWLPDDVPPADNAADGEGYNPAFDKVYECFWTVEDGIDWYGEAFVNIKVFDQSGGYTRDGIMQTWFFNPVIFVDLGTNNGDASLSFEEGVPGETVYSNNKLVITNLAEGGVDLRTWIGASDMTDPAHSGALCPYSNVLDTDAIAKGIGSWGMEYRGKKGTFMGEWKGVTNKNPSTACEFEAGKMCYGLQDIAWGGSTDEQVIQNMHSAEVEFRLTYPVPCTGSFTDGSIYVVVRAV